MEQEDTKKVSYKSKKTVWIPKKDWIVVPGTHEGIIERDSFERVSRCCARMPGAEAGAR